MRHFLTTVLVIGTAGGAAWADGRPRPIHVTEPTAEPPTVADQEPDRCWWLPEGRHGQPVPADVFAVLGGSSDPFAPLPALCGTTIATPPSLFDRANKSADALAAPALRPDGPHQVATGNLAADWANLSGKVKLRERDVNLDPSARNTWETDETVKLPVGGSVFVFNQVTGSTPAVEQQQYKWLGKTGVGVKLKPWLFQEVQLRTGPAVRYDDTGTLSKGQSPERSELFLEAVTKVPLPVVGPVNVEYSSFAVPAATSADRNQINQDFKVALPIGGGQFHVGAKYKWEAASATPWMDRMQLYLGVQNKW
jgi:hypothetical protein